MSSEDTKETVVPVAVPVEKLSESDVNRLELAKMNKRVALANAEKALAENNSAELAYKYTVLELYMKYGLTAADALDEQGNVHRGVNKG